MKILFRNWFWICYPFQNCGQVHLDKKVPTGAGLGGGSSNAATALWAANQFSGCLATEKELQQWSSEIGSDIPFFFSNGAAFCTGRGEVCLHLTWDVVQSWQLLPSNVIIKLYGCTKSYCKTFSYFKNSLRTGLC